MQNPRSISSERLKLKFNATKHVLLLDLDNTLTDTRRWFANFILSSTEELAHALKIEPELLNRYYGDVALATTLHEYAFVVETIAAKVKAHSHLPPQKIMALAESFWEGFQKHHQNIEVYEGVHQTLAKLRSHFRSLDIIILTDSPDWVAIDRLALTGLLPLVHGLVAIRTEMPELRHTRYRDCLQKSKDRILAIKHKHDTRHLKLKLAISKACAKPSCAGIELIAKSLDGALGELMICGDKESKEGMAAQNWRQYQRLTGEPTKDIHFIKADYGNYDLTHHLYQELEKQIHSLKAPKVNEQMVSAGPPVFRALERCDQLTEVIEEIISGKPSLIEVA